MDNNKSEEIARLNDDFRHHLSKGTLVLTSGIRCNTKEDIAEIMTRTASTISGHLILRGKRYFGKSTITTESFCISRPMFPALV